MSVGVLSGWLSSGVAWINQFGAFGWLIAFLIGCLMSTAILALAGLFRLRFAEARILNIAAKNLPMDSANPLDKEFHKMRIRLDDIKHPLGNFIKGKKFTDCQLVGPSTIIATNNISFVSISFLSCDFILTKNDTYINNVIPLENCVFHGGEIINATIYINPDLFQILKDMPGIYFVNKTGDLAIDSQLPPNSLPRYSK